MQCSLGRFLLLLQGCLALTLSAAGLILILAYFSPTMIIMTAFYIIFGILMCVTLFPCEIMKRNFYLLKTTTGRGIFNIFVAFMLIIGGELAYYLFAAGFLFVGVMFIVLARLTDKCDADNEIGKPVGPKLIISIA